MRRARRAVALPLVVGFCVLAVIFGFMMSAIRVEDKRQNLMGFQQLKAYYLAQAGVQHALVKIRILPNEVYDAGALARGVCPFTPVPAPGASGSRTSRVLDAFAFDVVGSGSATGISSGIPFLLARPGEESNWSYRIASIKALTTFTRVEGTGDPAADKVNVLELVAVGYVQDKLASNQRAGGPATAAEKQRWERVTKMVEITRAAGGS